MIKKRMRWPLAAVLLMKTPRPGRRVPMLRMLVCWCGSLVAMSVLCFPYSVIVFAYGSGSSRLSPRNPRVVQALNARQLGTLQFDLLSEAEATERANVPVRGAGRAGAGGRRCWRLGSWDILLPRTEEAVQALFPLVADHLRSDTGSLDQDQGERVGEE